MKPSKLKMGVLIGLVAFGIAFADNFDDDFQVTATVDPYCEIYSSSDITLTYNPFDPASSTGTGTFSFACVKGTTFSISAISQNAGAGDNMGYLKNGTYTIDYSLAVVVNYISGGVSGSQSNIFQTPLTLTAPTKDEPDVEIDMVIANAGQNVPAGIYTDTVTLMIAY